MSIIWSKRVPGSWTAIDEPRIATPNLLCRIDIVCGFSKVAGPLTSTSTSTVSEATTHSDPRAPFGVLTSSALCGPPPRKHLSRDHLTPTACSSQPGSLRLWTQLQAVLGFGRQQDTVVRDFYLPRATDSNPITLTPRAPPSLSLSRRLSSPLLIKVETGAKRMASHAAFALDIGSQIASAVPLNGLVESFCGLRTVCHSEGLEALPNIGDSSETERCGRP
ncbi:hypothetical protein EVG20_g5211 [Dentipellis fragilis]|uniref:Uncharacterized protein n=1 Tax=Dentipellis fragilis TaxID=205917 RepID=A0A4Y9YVW5_9AGAM|nr:hypothetical protein EVG20_g5211 [Dentipellis fragilis]